MDDSQKHNSYSLFLDDQRMPSEAVLTFPRHPAHLRKVLLPKFLVIEASIPAEDWLIVRNYDEFVFAIKAKGLPKVVSFDFDLSPEMTQHYFDHAKIHGYIDYNKLKTKTGLHCAKFLVDFYNNNPDTNKPKVFIHSANIYGARDMKGLLKQTFDVT